ncbi:MAG TPA: FKBP-type peptidyl-prolyl cis-trans isomerase N-terminal domain-containing protein, partial [Gammaproteobacteria bacterium]|nr:FKBP-type peptidyl-prolyl cis-trans isomerase N-terminal domain-containing protein [Gammaproteobacteria bacterium]
MKTLFRYFFIFLLMLALPVQAETGLTTDKQKLSYALGVYFSKSIAGQTQNIDNAAFLQAIEDVLGDKQLKLTTEEMK